MRNVFLVLILFSSTNAFAAAPFADEASCLKASGRWVKEAFERDDRHTCLLPDKKFGALCHDRSDCDGRGCIVTEAWDGDAVWIRPSGNCKDNLRMVARCYEAGTNRGCVWVLENGKCLNQCAD